jgi:hypothetical protein
MRNAFLALTLVLLGAATVLLPACAAAECEDGEQQCSGTQIQTCVDGAWGAATDCDGMMECMTMDDGVQHCMDMTM